jgi:hypothetical protein
MSNVIEAVTIRSDGFAVVETLTSGEILRDAGTLMAANGLCEPHTPADDLKSVMPSIRPWHEKTAARD